MTRAAVAPEDLTPLAQVAWHRIRAGRTWRGPQADIWLRLAAEACATYMSFAAGSGLDPALHEPLRLDARRMLRKATYLPRGSIRLGRLTEDGLDADIVALCAPLDDPAPRPPEPLTH